MKKAILITKASGEPAQFSEGKLRGSLQRAGASEEQIDQIIEHIVPALQPGMSTKKIYRMAFNLLRGSGRHLAARYHLKRAIMELGPSGYPFEKFIGEILEHQGYRIELGQTIQGKCVRHEVDVVAQVDHLQLMLECKYHNQPGTICDVKVPLYIDSRFRDVEAQWRLDPQHTGRRFQGGVVTNTRFSGDAITYGTCAGLMLLGWNYPLQNSLKDQIDRLRLYPVTCLTGLTQHEKRLLLDQRIVLCKELLKREFLLEQIGVKPPRLKSVMQECRKLCERAQT